MQDDDARRIFLMAGRCAPNRPIPCELLERAAGLDTETCDGALSILTGLGLLEMSEDKNEAGAGPLIHPLLAEYARNQVFPKNLVSDLADALVTLAYQANETGLPAEFALLRLHLENVAPAAEEEGLELAGRLWNSLGYHLDMVADYAAARAAYERALAIDEAAFGPEHPKVARDVNNLGLVLQDLGDLAGARAAFERALAIFEKFLPPDHPSIKTVRGNLSILDSLI